MTKPKNSSSKKKKVRGGPHPRVVYNPDPAKMAVGSALGAAMGAIVGVAFVRNPNLFNDAMTTFGGMLTHPSFLSALQSMGVSVTGPVTYPSPPASHPPGGCGVPGCPTNNPHAFEEEEARVSQENPSWTHTQVQAEVSARLSDQADRAHMADAQPKRKSRSKKNSEGEPEDTTN